MTDPLSIAARVYAELREKLKADYGLEDEDQILSDTLEGATNLPEMLAKLAREVMECEAISEAISARQKDMAVRAARLETKAQHLRVSLAWAMEEAGLKRIPADALPEATVSLGKGKASLIIPDDDMVPMEFCRQPKPLPDRKAVREAIERTGPQSWAYLGNAKPTLIIKTR